MKESTTGPPVRVAAAIVSTEPGRRERLAYLLERHPRVASLLTLGDYPSALQMEPLAELPMCVLFLDYGDGARARAVAAELDRSYPGVVTIAIHPRRAELDLADLMKIGIREVVEENGSFESMAIESFDRAVRKLLRESKMGDAGAPLFAFLPARPGSGATTLAVHTSAAAARLTNSPTLLIDLDLRLGMTSFLLKLNGERSVLDALALSARLDDTLWEGLVHRRGKLEILGSAPVDFSQEHVEVHTPQLLQFARQRYGVVCVDLPGELREHEVEALQRAQEIFLVCTPEMGTLHMARRKAEALKTLDLYPRVSLLVNRADHRGPLRLSADQIAEITQVPVRLTFPSDESTISAATRDGVPLDGRSALVQQIIKLGQRIAAGSSTPVQGAKPRSFIDYFSISQIREKTSGKN